MKLCMIGHDFRYELEKLIRLFLPFEKITFALSDDGVEDRCITAVTESPDGLTLSAALFFGGKSYRAAYTLPTERREDADERERLLALALFDCFCAASGYTPQWGILTGVRPAKLFSRLRAAEGESAAEKWFADALRVSGHKISLCRQTAEAESRITGLSRPDSYSLYISIPFCPTRCSYCSFVSHSVENAKGLVPRYVELLTDELARTAVLARNLGLHLETVYIGGGTPTALSAEQLAAVMTAVREHFDLSGLREYTVEAGRPDTVTLEKLEVIRCHGGTRVSINPQTMNDEVLRAIGRRHTARQTIEAFTLARACGFSNINTDLIAGLPGDSFASFCQTLEQVLILAPESVTVHTLAMKRASALSTNGLLPAAKMGEEAAKMVDYARETLGHSGFSPYYMYRQSKTVGNLENVGYAKPGREGYYNVFTMDETHTVLSCGAAAVTKLRQPGGNHIERIFNFKYPYEYISRYDELVARKDGITRFYEQYPAIH